MNLLQKTVYLVLGLIAALSAAPAGAQTDDYTDIVVFGDSLSDVGNTANNFLISLVSPQAQPPYYQGRFSNGPVWVEHLATSLDLNASIRSGNGGLNYAEGGALSGDGSNFLGLIDNLGNQVDNYLGDHNPTGDELFVVWGGANDLIEIGGSLGGLFSGGGTPQSVSSNLAGHVQTLANAGAQNILVLNLPSLGQIPRYLGTSEQAAQNVVSQQFNALLDSQLGVIETQQQIDIDILDVSALFDQLLIAPDRYGFTNITDPAFDESSGDVVADPTGYAFWDDIHPAALTHEWIATAARVALMEAGDLTGNGTVDAEDLDIVLTHWGASVTPFDLSQGDMTGDGVVGQGDLNLVLNNWGDGAPPTQVPEPGSVSLLILSCLLIRRRPHRVR